MAGRADAYVKTPWESADVQKPQKTVTAHRAALIKQINLRMVAIMCRFFLIFLSTCCSEWFVENRLAAASPQKIAALAAQGV